MGRTFVAGLVLFMGILRSENICRVHHLYVCTPRDPVTARINEAAFTAIISRVLWQCLGVVVFTAQNGGDAACGGAPACCRGPIEPNPLLRYLARRGGGFVALR